MGNQKAAENEEKSDAMRTDEQQPALRLRTQTHDVARRFDVMNEDRKCCEKAKLGQPGEVDRSKSYFTRSVAADSGPTLLQFCASWTARQPESHTLA